MSHDRAEALADQVTQLRRELSLAEEGLASYAQENEQMKAALERIATSQYAIEGTDADDEVIQSQHHHIMMLRGIARGALHPSDSPIRSAQRESVK